MGIGIGLAVFIDMDDYSWFIGFKVLSGAQGKSILILLGERQIAIHIINYQQLL
jgi:hypothetical protein